LLLFKKHIYLLTLFSISILEVVYYSGLGKRSHTIKTSLGSLGTIIHKAYTSILRMDFGVLRPTQFPTLHLRLPVTLTLRTLAFQALKALSKKKKDAGMESLHLLRKSLSIAYF